MRIARRLGLLGGGSLKILSEGSWDFKYAGQDKQWNTSIPDESGTTNYWARQPYLDGNGDHVFRPPDNYNCVVVACTPIVIDIRKYSRIRVKYKEWINADVAPSAIELLPESNTSYLLQPGNDIRITHASDTTPGEIVYTIPSEAKSSNTKRRIWIKGVRNYWSGGTLSLVISSITLER